ncbi:hypothetical protein DMUE_2481 [Dictyocoela muelleri]|nr:hypothetical protein DMUE_2481 [Dictyocoela muelleri]
MRIYKNNQTTKDIIYKIEYRNNMLKNRLSNYTPNLLFYMEKYLNIPELNSISRNIIIKQNKTSKISLSFINKKRIPYEYKIRDIVYHKAHVMRKTDALYNGPFEVLNKSECSQRLLISDKYKSFWCKFKNIKPGFKNEDGGRVW